ncbi:hypothetical protein OJAV_G00215010 [Oryzias javanicus]|uniref:ATPase inhibitor, mitochondrial n=1 Tax=Oryzias javanicus TaxID=123683 RepID=A0A3S2TWV2_ORYJA|nr:hypothetical protein OJAV_G00215010 [Oryzias javanicus]
MKNAKTAVILRLYHYETRTSISLHCFSADKDKLQCQRCFHLGESNMARFLRPSIRSFVTSQLRMSSDQLGELGQGAGKGGGGGGSIREAGGAMGKRQAAEEEMYFKRKEKEQLAALRHHHEEEIDHHKKEIERLQREIDRHKGKIRKLKHDD